MATTYRFYYKNSESTEYELWQEITVDLPYAKDGTAIPDATALGNEQGGNTSLKGWSIIPDRLAINFYNGDYITNSTPNLYAVFNTYTVAVQYINGDSTAEETQEFVSSCNYIGTGTTTITINNLTKKGYSFLGWAPQQTGAQQYYVQYNSVSLEVDNEDKAQLYAYWEPNTYTVSFYTNYNTSQLITTKNGTPESSVSLNLGEDEPERSDYLLMGWNTQPNGTGTAYTVNDTIFPEENINLYAVWQYNYSAATYTDAIVIRSDLNGSPEETGTCATISFNCNWPKLGTSLLQSNLRIYCEKDNQIIVDQTYQVTDSESTIPLTNGLVGPLTFETFALDKEYTFEITIEPIDRGDDESRASTQFTLYLSNVSFIVDVNEDGSRLAFGGVATSSTGSEDFISGVEMRIPFIDEIQVNETLKGSQIFKVTNEIETIDGTATDLSDSVVGSLTKDLSSLISSTTSTFDITMRCVCHSTWPSIKTKPNIGQLQLIQNIIVLWSATLNFDKSTDKTETVTFAFYSKNVLVNATITIQYTASNNIIVITPTYVSADSSTIQVTTQLSKFQPKEYFAIPIIEFGTAPGAKDTNIWKGFYTDGEKRKIFELPNKTNNISIGYGAYEFINGGGTLTGGNTNIYGRGIKLQTVEGLDFRTSSGQIASLSANGNFTTIGTIIDGNGNNLANKVELSIEEVTTSSITVTAGGTGAATASVAKTGYTPLCIVGFTKSGGGNGYALPSSWKLENSTATIYYYNPSSSSASFTTTIHILYKKS